MLHCNKEYGVVWSVHTNSTTSVKATDTLPSVPACSCRYELNDTYKVCTTVAADAILPTYCLTCSSKHDPSSPLSTSLAVRVTEQKVENRLWTSSFCYDKVISQGPISNCDEPASEVGNSHNNHSNKSCNSKNFKEFQSGFENFTTSPTSAQLEAQYDRQFNAFTNSLYHALREYDPVRAESILFNTQMPMNKPPS